VVTGCTFTVTVSIELQPLELVTVTVNKVLVVGFTSGLEVLAPDCMAEAGLQEYNNDEEDPVVCTLSLVDWPGQIPCGLAEDASVTIFADVRVTVVMSIQPSESVATTLYTFLTEGIICTVSVFAID
jgi:hypothetical protein